MDDEGLDRFSYYSIKRDVLVKAPEQVVANVTLSETVTAKMITRSVRLNHSLERGRVRFERLSKVVEAL